MQEKITIITGAGKGIGKALAIGMSRVGFSVVATARRVEDLQETAKRLQGVHYITKCDISIWNDCEKLLESVVEKYGRIDILINNASGWVDKSLLQATKKDIDELMDTTIKGTTFMTKLCLQRMSKQKSGHIFTLLTSSYRHGIGRFGNKILTPYYAAKFGSSGLTEALKREAAEFNVKVTSIYLGSIASDLDIDDDENKLLKAYGKKRVHVKSVVDIVNFIANQSSNTLIDEVIISPIGDFST